MKRLINNLTEITFEGRIGIKEYWFTMFVLMGAAFIFSFALTFFVVILMAMSSTETMPAYIFAIFIFAIIAYSVYVAIWSTSMMIRRLHDLNYSGWMYLISFIPYLGNIILLVFSLMPGKNESNQYGPVRHY